MTPLLSLQGLRVEFGARAAGRKRSVTVIDDLDLEVLEGETLAVVGESGAGKSTLAEAVVGLIHPTGGSIRFSGTELVGLRGQARRRMRSRMQMVAQNPLLALNPRQAVGNQVEEPLRVHTSLNRAHRRLRANEMIAALDLSPAMRDRLPHELSGGQAQRVVLARALILEPSMIIFDEPTSSLDVSVQAGVLNLLQQIKADHGLTYLFITHDLGVARHLADRIAVMRSGQIVEQQTASALFDHPQHAYTRTLIASALTV
ncbi:ABC transporter ATP-binding protein [Candidatus Poriferisodalis sp.]|uniref:ABC transporter ATP-binding protein n=1 Tax=Candidatus Poriferisodalis sp. TaxID=3101277 RepID=UPI003B01367B